MRRCKWNWKKEPNCCRNHWGDLGSYKMHVWYLYNISSRNKFKKKTIEIIGAWTYGVVIDWRIGASNNPLVIVGIDEGRITTIRVVWYRWGTFALASWLAKKWWIHTKLVEYSIVVNFCLVQQQIHDLSLLVTCLPSSKHNGVVCISASSSKCWVLDVGAPKPRSCMNRGVGSARTRVAMVHGELWKPFIAMAHTL
jgi:hypothetical protein